MEPWTGEGIPSLSHAELYSLLQLFCLHVMYVLRQLLPKTICDVIKRLVDSIEVSFEHFEFET